MTFDRAHEKMVKMSRNSRWETNMKRIPPAVFRYYYEMGRKDRSDRPTFLIREPKPKNVVSMPKPVQPTNIIAGSGVGKEARV